MDDNVGLYFIFNGVLKDSANPEYLDTVKNRVVYEAIRIIDGIPLFFEDHYLRMEKSISSIGGVLSITVNEFSRLIKVISDANKSINCNIKIAVYEENGRQNALIYLSKSYYPSKEEMDRGASVGLLQLERNDPNAKLFNQTYRDTVNKSINEGNFFEVLLVNNYGEITEGSKSNVFFVKENKIFTAPGTHVLKGVTRKYVIEACETAGFEVIEQFTYKGGLGEIEGVFLSGTSINVFPVSSIDNCLFKSSTHPVISSVRDEYSRVIKKNIDNPNSKSTRP